jgi:hypothetical protein
MGMAELGDEELSSKTPQEKESKSNVLKPLG